MSLLRLSFNLLRRDWRSGEWRVLMLALVLAVGSLSTVGLFADRVRQALVQQAASLLGADLRITSTRPFTLLYRQEAKARGLQVIESLIFPSMVSYSGNSSGGAEILLCEIQAVEPGYPLRGSIEIENAALHVARKIPQPGTVWVDERLMRRLALHAGDQIGLGVQHFIVAGFIVKDVEPAIGFAGFAPRVLMNQADVASTGLLQAGSRISYRLMIAGDARQVVRLRAALAQQLTANEKMEDVSDARPEIRIALERAEHFSSLAALTTAILAGVAILLAARRYVMRHLDGCAVMRCLGARQGQILWLFLYQFLLAGLLAVLVGLLLGYATQAALAGALMSGTSLPQPGILPAVKAALSGYALLLGFAFLPLLQLRRVSPLKVIRRELGLPSASGWLIYGLAGGVLAVLFLWQAGSLKLGVTVLAGLLTDLLLSGGMAWWLLHTLARYSSKMKFLPNNLARHDRSVALQVAALSLGGMALLVLTLVRGDLLQAWQDKLPFDTPNRFVMNIQPDQQLAVQNFFKEKDLPVQLLPMVRGRLTAINGQEINSGSYLDPRARSLVEREFNLSYSDKMPAWNTLVSGTWWNSTEPQTGNSKPETEDSKQLSVEEGIAKTLNIHLGDMLTYDVAGTRFQAKVSSFRKVQWDSMRVNFFVIATPALLRDYPASYLSSIYLPPDKVAIGDELVRTFPNLLVIDSGAVIAQLRSIIERVSGTISVIFLFTQLAGLLVLYAALLASQDERVYEVAILRTLGADSGYLRRLHLSEFAVTGALAGLFAAASAAFSGWLLARYVLDIPYHGGYLVWLSGMLGGLLLVMLAGWLVTRSLMNMPPLRILRGE